MNEEIRSGRRSTLVRYFATRTMGASILVAVAVGVLPTILYAVQFPLRRSLSIVGVAVLLASSALAVGALLGFLFGIPRTMQDSGGTRPLTGAMPSSVREQLQAYGPNTNLEQISDWLTKILVGVGLVQIGRLGPGLGELVDYVAPGLGGTDASKGFALSLLLYYVVVGFLCGYLWVRLYFVSLLRRSELMANRWEAQQARALKETVEALPPPEKTHAVETEPETEISAAKRDQVVELGQRVREFETSGLDLDADGYLRLARQLKRAGAYEEAERGYLRASELRPTDPGPLNMAAVVNSKYLGNYGRAAELYGKALKLNPSFASAIYNLACNEVRRGNYREGLKLLEQATTQDPDRYRRLALRDAEPGGAFEALKDDERFRRLVAQEPTEPEQSSKTEGSAG